MQRSQSPFRISALGSGSKGNSTLLQFGPSVLMIDCGFGLKETKSRLEVLGIEPSQIDAILVTHEHSDHISGVEAFAVKYSRPVYMTEGTSRAWKSKRRVLPNIIRAGQSLDISGISVMPVAVPHDAREPVQFVLACGGQQIGVLTDLGSLSRNVCVAYQDCDTLLIEANHDLQMLHNGPYPQSLKHRVAGDWGHLNNVQTAEFIKKINKSEALNRVIIAHISEKNNTLDSVEKALKSCTLSSEKIVFAQQNAPLPWIDLDPNFS